MKKKTIALFVILLGIGAYFFFNSKEEMVIDNPDLPPVRTGLETRSLNSDPTPSVSKKEPKKIVKIESKSKPRNLTGDPKKIFVIMFDKLTEEVGQCEQTLARLKELKLETTDVMNLGDENDYLEKLRVVEQSWPRVQVYQEYVSQMKGLSQNLDNFHFAIQKQHPRHIRCTFIDKMDLFQAMLDATVKVDPETKFRIRDFLLKVLQQETRDAPDLANLFYIVEAIDSMSSMDFIKGEAKEELGLLRQDYEIALEGIQAIFDDRLEEVDESFKSKKDADEWRFVFSKEMEELERLKERTIFLLDRVINTDRPTIN